MKTTFIFLFISVLLILISCGGNQSTKKMKTDKLTVAAYYFPNYHTGEPRNMKNLGENWSEWELVKAAKPRFSGHQHPKVSLVNIHSVGYANSD